MPNFRKNITSYTIQFAANSFNPRIWLKEGSIWIGQCIFYPDGAALPPNSQAADGSANLQYHLSEYPMIMDILRNESPVYLQYVVGGESAIQTGEELPGEGE